MKDEKTRYKHYMPDYCTLGAQTGPQTIIVRQVLGEMEKQKVLDIHVCVPARKPAIEQIVDVFVKNVEVNCVDVIMNKVIVRGEFEIKAIYVACLPGNPVHAVEIKHYKWTQDIDIPGARRGMDAEASVICEFVDYDVAEMTRAYKYKYHGDCDPCDSTPDHCDCETADTCDSMPGPDDCYPPHHPMPPFKPPSGSCKPNMPPFQPPSGSCCKPNMPPFQPPCGSCCKPEMPPFQPPCEPEKPSLPPFQPPMEPCPPMNKPQKPYPPECPPSPPTSCMEICCRDFDVSVVLKVTAKVLADREVQMNPQPNMTGGANMTLPEQPKG